MRLAILAFVGSILFSTPVWASPGDTVAFDSVAGGDSKYPVNDRLSILPDGTVTFTTRSPADAPDGAHWRTQNKIGTFSFKSSPEAYQRLREAFRAGYPQITQPDGNHLRSGYDALHLKDDSIRKSIVRLWGGREKTIDRISAEVARLKAEALKHPVSAAELSCAMRPDSIVCSVRNLGQKPVEIPNPENSYIFCTDRQRHVIPLGGFPKSQTGTQVLTLQAKTTFEFKFQPARDEKCDFHIVLRGTNSEPGVLVSNEVAPAKSAVALPRTASGVRAE